MSRLSDYLDKIIPSRQQFITPVKTMVFIYVCALLLLTMFQRHLMYLPHSNHPKPADYDLTDTRDITLKTPDGITLQAWLHEPKKDEMMVIYVHGNGGNLGHRKRRFHAFEQAGYGFLGLSYRGYGASEGAPSEQGLYTDAQSAINYAIQQLGIPLSRILLYGESLGTGVAVEMAIRNRVAGLVLESPYESVVKRASELYFWAPVKWLLHDRYESIAKIAFVNTPLLIFHGARDTVIPISHGRAMFATASAPKKAVYFKHHGHGDFDSARLVEHITHYWNR